MKLERYRTTTEIFKVEYDKFKIYENLKCIILTNGEGIYPNWEHLRINFQEKCIYLQYGDIESFGGRFYRPASVTNDYSSISFTTDRYIFPSEYYDNIQPKIGWVVRVLEDDVIKESLIKNITKSIAGVTIELAVSIEFTKNAKLSFYNPVVDGVINKGDIIEGIYTKFIPYENGYIKKLKSKYIVHRIIKLNDVYSIEFKK